MNDPSEAGRFRSVGLHASGGIGSVFLAYDQQLNRSVALKEIQPRFADDDSSRERFLREAEVTAKLEHPGIVPVYGMGRYPDGRPYYAMRMIQGRSLHEAIIDMHRNRAKDPSQFEMELRRMLNRFITVCNTIEYAHSQGVLHRDIKPQNIMLGPYGETLVIDWGLAKFLNTSEKESTGKSGDDFLNPSRLHGTQAGYLVGTPAFMSPEQAMGWHDKLTNASDVYSLGVTLYAILTGTTPFHDTDISALLIQIQTQSYSKPRELNPLIPKSLEAVCLKAMAKSATNRYASAAELAGEIEAALAGEPVKAWNEPWQVRASRWVRRHRAWVMSGLGSAGVLFIALIVIVIVQKTANDKLAVANTNESNARKTAEKEWHHARENFQTARNAVDRFFTQVSEDQRLGIHGLEPLRRELLKSAGQFYEQLASQESRTEDVMSDRAWAKFRLASIVDEIASTNDAAVQFELAADSFRERIQNGGADVAQSREGLLMCELNLTTVYDQSGHKEKGAAALAEATQIAKNLIAESPQNSASNHYLASCFSASGRRARDQGNLDDARAAYEQEIEVREKLVELKPTDRTFQVELAAANRNLAVVEENRGHLNVAQKLLDQSLSIDRKLVTESPDDAFLKHMLARTLDFLGSLSARIGNDGQARNYYRESAELRTALVTKHPDVLEYRADLSKTTGNLGVFLANRGEYDEAEKSFGQSLSHADRLVTDYPSQPEYQRNLATTLLNAAMACVATDKFAIADQLLTRAYGIFDRLQKEFPNEPDRDESLASACLVRAIVDTSLHRADGAKSHLQTATDIFRRLMAKYPDVPHYAERLGACYKQTADLNKSVNQFAEAEQAYRAAIEIHSQLLASYPNVAKHREDLASTWINLGNMSIQIDRPTESIEAFDEAIKLFSESELSAGEAGNRSIIEKAYSGRAVAHEVVGDVKAMVIDLERAVALSSSSRQQLLQLKLAITLSETGEANRAIDVATIVVKNGVTQAWSAFDLSVIYFRAAETARATKPDSEPEPDSNSAKWIEVGLNLLKKAADANFFADPSNREQLKKAPFIPLLENNKEFQRILSTTETTSPPRK